MSQIIGNLPAPKVVSANQSPTGVGEFVVQIPMGFDTVAGTAFPAPSSFPFYPGYSPVKAQGKLNTGGDWVWEITYQGQAFLSGAGITADDNAVYAFEPADLELDIKIHPDWAAWVKQYNGVPDPTRPGKYTFTPPAGATGQNTVSGPLTDNIVDLGFLDSYTSFAGTWHKTYSVSGRLPADLYCGVEQIVLTVPTPSWLQLPKFGKRNWLKLEPILSIKGYTTEIKERYMLSGLRGHNTLVYNGSGQ